MKKKYVCTPQYDVGVLSSWSLQKKEEHTYGQLGSVNNLVFTNYIDSDFPSMEYGMFDYLWIGPHA